MSQGDEADVAKDPAGYLGQFTRINRKTEPISVTEFLNVFALENRMPQVTTMIRSIDKQRNGYITTSEMDDILKEVYPVAF